MTAECARFMTEESIQIENSLDLHFRNIITDIKRMTEKGNYTLKYVMGGENDKLKKSIITKILSLGYKITTNEYEKYNKKYCELQISWEKE